MENTKRTEANVPAVMAAVNRTVKTSATAHPTVMVMTVKNVLTAKGNPTEITKSMATRVAMQPERMQEVSAKPQMKASTA